MKGLRIRIGRDGRMYADTVGVTGGECLALVPVVEELMAARTVRSRYLPEFFDTRRDTDAAQSHETSSDEETLHAIIEREP